MSGSVLEILAFLNKFPDTARSDRFEVMITSPRLAAGFGNSRGLSFQCEAAEIPGRTLATFDARTYGPSIKYPYQTTYSDLNLTFFCVGGMPEKKFFDDWMEHINPTNEGGTIIGGSNNLSYKSEYAGDIQVTHFNVDGTISYSCNFIEAFPVAVNQIPLAWTDESHARLIVSFAYTRWRRIF